MADYVVQTVGNLNDASWWKKPGDGWVTFGPIHATAFKHFSLRGFASLVNKYGMIRISGENAHLSVTKAVELLLTKPGGVEEFPASQIIAYRWHLDPPIPGLQFPQLEGMEIEVFECPMCDRASFCEAMHLADHLTVAHKWDRRDLREYSEETGINFMPKRGPKRKWEPKAPPPKETVLIPVEQIEHPYKCPICEKADWGRDVRRFRGHVRFKHRKNAEETALILREAGAVKEKENGASKDN